MVGNSSGHGSLWGSGSAGAAGGRHLAVHEVTSRWCQWFVAAGTDLARFQVLAARLPW